MSNRFLFHNAEGESRISGERCDKEVYTADGTRIPFPDISSVFKVVDEDNSNVYVSILPIAEKEVCEGDIIPVRVEKKRRDTTSAR